MNSVNKKLTLFFLFFINLITLKPYNNIEFNLEEIIMKIKHTFKGSCGNNYGYYACIDGETNELVIGESWPHEGGTIFRGTYAQLSIATLEELRNKAPNLYTSITKYYSEHAYQTNTTKLEALRPGMNFKLKNTVDNNSRYMVVDMEVSKCFVFGEKLNGFAAAVSMEDYKVYLFDKSSEIELI
jgi:hypothetical protein